MGKTTVTAKKDSFHINGKPTYSEIPRVNPRAEGLLMNARFIQGVFDDAFDRERYARWGHDTFDPEKHTDDLIKVLPEWYEHGLRAFTVGFQGGGPCFTVDRATIECNPFGEDGTQLDPAYAGRMDRLIRAADEIGMVVVVSFFYGHQALRLRDGKAVRNAVTGASRFLREGGYTNVIIEPANEQNIDIFARHPIIRTAEGMACLIDLARQESGGMLVGCSGGGGDIYREICEASDVLLIHGNSCSRQRLSNVIGQVREWVPGRPVVCNEDSQAIGNMVTAMAQKVSWGYYNNMTKQEPPADWGITPGEDRFFAIRMAREIGIDVAEPPEEEQYYLQGLEPDMTYNNQRWIRLASLHPETIDFVDFYRNGVRFYRAYDEPFSINFLSNWKFDGVENEKDDQEWRAEIHLGDDRVIEKIVKL